MTRGPDFSYFRGLVNSITNCFHRRSTSSSFASPDSQTDTAMDVTSAPNIEQPVSLSSQTTTSKEIPPKVDCSICTNVILDAVHRPCRTCADPWCKDCVRNLFVAATWDLERMPARCHSKVVHHNVAKDILTEDELAKYKLKYEEFCTAKPFYCPVPTCSTFLPPRKLKAADPDNQLSCPVCQTMICTKCRQNGGDGHQCASNTILEKIQALKYKLCPKCGTGVQKMYGCSHMRCHCGAHFCWECERSIEVCWSDPCPPQVEDGTGAQIDTDDEGSEHDGAEPATIALNEPVESVADQHTNLSVEEPSILPTVSLPEQIPDILPVLPIPPPAIVASPLLVSNPAEIIPETATELSTNAAVPVTPEDNTDDGDTLTENLDDPEANNWEYEDFNFGAEPVEESWDVWGCAHRSKRFEVVQMHQGWLGHREDLECQTCFERIYPHPTTIPAVEPQILKKRTRSGETVAHEAHTPAEIERLAGNQVAAEKEQVELATETPESDSEVASKMAWECKKCGIFFCVQCRDGLKARWKGMHPGDTTATLPVT